jgi:hypothetical protein
LRSQSNPRDLAVWSQRISTIIRLDRATITYATGISAAFWLVERTMAFVVAAERDIHRVGQEMAAGACAKASAGSAPYLSCSKACLAGCMSLVVALSGPAKVV